MARPALRDLLVAGSIASSMASGGGCTGSARKPAEAVPHSVARYPHAADRLIRLVRRQLSDADPVRTEQEAICETERMALALGYEEAGVRIRTALDTAYLTARDSLAFGRVERLLGGQTLGTGDHVCDSVIAAADREDPIVPVDSAKP